jgi:hypothetical protein
MGLLDDSSSNAVVEDRVEIIRTAMLDSIAELVDPQARQPAVWDKVIEASCVQSLWYLRIDLMGFLSANCGETLAKDKLATITEQFRGVIPDNQLSKSKRFAG